MRSIADKEKSGGKKEEVELKEKKSTVSDGQLPTLNLWIVTAVNSDRRKKKRGWARKKLPVPTPK